MRATRDNVIVQVLKPQEKTSGGLFLADESKKQETAKVLAVCDNWLELQAEPLNVGDIIVFAEKCGKEFILPKDALGLKEGDAVLILNHREVLMSL